MNKMNILLNQVTQKTFEMIKSLLPNVETINKELIKLDKNIAQLSTVMIKCC